MPFLRRWLSALGRPAVVAHRGASFHAPENSLLALRLAHEWGADAVEFDVQRCGSGELVVFHDRTLARCTGALGSIGETPLDTLRALTLDRIDRVRTGQARGERIPTLAEWLAAAPRGLALNLEVKADTLAETTCAPACVELLRRTGWAEHTVVSSFHPAALLQVRGVDKGTLVEEAPDWKALLTLGLAAGAQAVHPEHTLVTRARVEGWHRLGRTVATWTVDDPEEARRLFDAGVDVLITNRPDLMRPLSERYVR